MPSQKDFKRIVRARMQKTGESYTTARSQVLKKSKIATQAAPPERAAPVDYATRAGMRDEAIKAKTGCAWDKWVFVLDRAGAAEWPHKDIARYVSEKYKLSGWWAQSVTVGYERIKGLRAIGQRRSGEFEAGKSRTLPVPIGRLYRAFRDVRVRRRWLDVEPVVRTSIKDKSIRMTWDDSTSVEVYFTAKGTAKSQVAVQHRKLGSRAAAEARKRYWGEQLDRLGEELRQ